MTIGEAIRTKRKELGLTMRQFARMIGTNASTVSRLESEQTRNVTYNTKRMLLEKCGIDIDILEKGTSMTKTDLRNIIGIIDDTIENEKRLAEGFINVNPSYEKERNHDRDCAIRALISARIAIIDEYDHIWKQYG